MIATNIVLPFLAMIVGAFFAVRVNGENSLVWGAAIGFGVGCAIVALVWLLFALLQRWADGPGGPE
jgi:hypothetical protein